MKLDDARSYLDVFGSSPTAEEVESIYRRLSLVAHPDMGGSDELFVKLSEFKHRAIYLLLQGRYGVDYHVEFATKKTKYGVVEILVENPLWQLCLVESDDGLTIARISNAPTSNALLEREAKNTKSFDSRFALKVQDAAIIDGRRVNVFAAPPGTDRLVPVSRILESYPSGWIALDTVWIIRRLLVGLSAAHEAGVVCAGVVPSGVLIDPVDHGVILSDWCQSTGDKVVTAAYGHRDWYPSEVVAKQRVSVATDLYMVARMFDYLSPSKVEPLTSFVKGCMMDSMASRPSSAADMLADLDNLLERLGDPYYPRRFRESPLLTK